MAAKDLRSDAELLAQSAEDRHAFGVLFDRYARVVFATAYAVTGSRQLAEEILSDSFVVLWRKRGEVVLTESALPYLMATARNLARNQRRAARDDVEWNDFVGASPAGSAEQAAAIRDLNRQLEQVINQLEPLDREIVALCLVDGLSYEAAAARLGITHSTVRNRLSRSRTQLRRNLTEEES